MKLLLLADEESKFLWDFYEPEKLANLDLIISCGDLQPEYLEFLATFAHCPVFYVHGNHDMKYLKKSPEGCICIDDTIITYQGIRILGLGGCMQYNQKIKMPFQCTEKQMQKRIKKLKFNLWKHHGFDILVTHAPAKNLNDLPDMPHNGFACFRELLDNYQPKLFCHGHVHLNYSNLPRQDIYHKTIIINAYEKYYYDFCA